MRKIELGDDVLIALPGGCLRPAIVTGMRHTVEVKGVSNKDSVTLENASEYTEYAVLWCSPANDTEKAQPDTWFRSEYVITDLTNCAILIPFTKNLQPKNPAPSGPVDLSPPDIS